MSQIYKIINLISKKIYVGKSLVPNENYYGSGLKITAAIKKYGKENFSKEILEECSETILDQQEIFWIEKLDARNPIIGYNISIGGTGGNHYWKSLDESGRARLKEKIKESKINEHPHYTEYQREKVKESLNKFWGTKKHDREWLKNRASPKNYILSDETIFIKIQNLSSYCIENNLDKTWLCSIATGKKFTPCKNYYCVFDSGQTDAEVLIQIQLIKEKKKEIFNNWLTGTQNREKYECIHCKKMATKTNLTRWHNNNCKENGKNNTTDTRRS